MEVIKLYTKVYYFPDTVYIKPSLSQQDNNKQLTCSLKFKILLNFVQKLIFCQKGGFWWFRQFFAKNEIFWSNYSVKNSFACNNLSDKQFGH